MSNRQALRTVDCSHLTSAAIDGAYKRYWEQIPRPEPLAGRHFVLKNATNRPWTQAESQDPCPEHRRKWKFHNMKPTQTAIDTHRERHANDPDTLLIRQKTALGGGAKPKAKASGKKLGKGTRAESPEDKPAPAYPTLGSFTGKLFHQLHEK